MSVFRQWGGGGTYYRPSLLGGFRFFPPVIKWLLMINGGLWLLVDLLLDPRLLPFTVDGVPVGGGNGIITFLLALWPPGPQFFPWQIFTYMYMHGGFFHLLFNMLALWMFGMELENVWGSRKFFLYYTACGIAGGLAHLAVGMLMGHAAPTVGASGAVFGILVAFGMLFPNRPIYIYFLLPVRAKYLISIYILLELFYGVTGTTDGVAHFAHLGGAALGALYMLTELNIIPVRQWLSLARQDAEAALGTRDVRRKGEPAEDARFYDIRTGKERTVDDLEVNQEVVDEILDKISQGGYQSLSEREKRILNEASKKIH